LFTLLLFFTFFSQSADLWSTFRQWWHLYLNVSVLVPSTFRFDSGSLSVSTFIISPFWKIFLFCQHGSSSNACIILPRVIFFYNFYSQHFLEMAAHHVTRYLKFFKLKDKLYKDITDSKSRLMSISISFDLLMVKECSETSRTSLFFSICCRVNRFSRAFLANFFDWNMDCSLNTSLDVSHPLICLNSDGEIKLDLASWFSMSQIFAL